jgi:hypothetical protein
MLIPLYGFLRGDTIGLLILVDDTEPVAELAAKLQQAARVRVQSRPRVEVWYKGKLVDPALTVSEARLEPLDRFDVVQLDD